MLPTVVGPRGARISRCLLRLRRRPGARPYLDSLTAAGLLSRDEARLLGFIPVTTHTLTDPDARASRVARIDGVLASPLTAPPRDLALTTLAATVDLTSHLHPTRPDRQARRLLTDLTRADPSPPLSPSPSAAPAPPPDPRPPPWWSRAPPQVR
ncbi:GOLPH3/VPS74 family protein [Streptacidiphilus neutrinimicus]|uniref:GOLPH3/VPS74 family protein n=1 Tax=Streptacidiphilus neutrinimicus TaxID=105420 RepID=UPI0034E1DC9E